MGHDADRLVEAATQAIAGSADALGADGRSAAHGVRDLGDALALLERLESALEEVGGSEAAAHLHALRSAQAGLVAARIAEQRSMLPVLNHALDELRTATSVAELTAAVPYRAVQLGYDRALFSWVDHERWVPHSAHFSSNGQMAQDLLDAGTPPYLHVREVLEVEVVRQRRPILVTQAIGNPRVHPQLIQVTNSRSYVAAPVVARGRVAAFVHLDKNLDTSSTDAFDRDLLAAFCQGVGLMLDHLFALEDGDVGDTRRPSIAPWPAALTGREGEVLQLLAAGLTNAEIADRLYLGEETIKTHVKKLMRKLGVTNRAQAGALYVRFRERAEQAAARA